MMYFWYEKTITGTWMPCKSDAPPGKRLGPFKPKLSTVVTLSPALVDKSLTELVAIYSPPSHIVPDAAPYQPDLTVDQFTTQVADGIEVRLREIYK